MIALEKDLMLSRCKHRELACQSRVRPSRSARGALGRRPGLAGEGPAQKPVCRAPKGPAVRPGDTRTVRFAGGQTRSGSTGKGAGAIELYLREVGRVRTLAPKAERTLAARAQRGDTRAREDLLKSNLRLVVGIAQEYEGIGFSLFDLIAEGNLGLMKAVSRFDPALHGRLAPLASWWIRQAIKRALANHARSGRQG